MKKNENSRNLDRSLTIISILLTIFSFIKDWISWKLLIYIIVVIITSIIFRKLSIQYSDSPWVKKLNINNSYRGFTVIPIFLIAWPVFHIHFRGGFTYQTIIIVSLGILISMFFLKFTQSKWVTLRIVLLFVALFVAEDWAYKNLYDESIESLDVSVKYNEDFSELVNERELVHCNGAPNSNKKNATKSYLFEDGKILIMNNWGMVVDELQIMTDSSSSQFYSAKFDKKYNYLAVRYNDKMEIWDIRKKEKIRQIPFIREFYSSNGKLNFLNERLIVDKEIRDDSYDFKVENDTIRLAMYYHGLGVEIWCFGLDKSTRIIDYHFNDTVWRSGIWINLTLIEKNELLVCSSSSGVVIYSYENQDLEIVKEFHFRSRHNRANYIAGYNEGLKKYEIWEIGKNQISKHCQIGRDVNLKDLDAIDFIPYEKYLILKFINPTNKDLREFVIFNSETCETIISPPLQHRESHFQYAIDIKNNLIALSGKADGTHFYYIKLYNLETGAAITSFKGHKYSITRLEFSECSNTLYSASYKEFKVWKLPSLF